MPSKYDFALIQSWREAGLSWADIGAHYGTSADAPQIAFNRFLRGEVQAAPAPQRPRRMRILGIDIETAPHTGHIWGLWKQNIGLNQILATGRVMCFAARWYGEPGAPVVFHTEHRGGHRAMVQAAHDLLTEADAVVHFNGNNFDMPMLNREFLKYRMHPPTSYKGIDLLLTARKNFKFPSNRLKHLLHELDLEQKVETRGHQLWIDCMNGDDVTPEQAEAAWEEMEEYNRGDVTTMEELYVMLLPWIKPHPNHALYMDTDNPVCTNCGGSNLEREGYQFTGTQRYKQYRCTDCYTLLRERRTDVSADERGNVLAQA